MKQKKRLTPEEYERENLLWKKRLLVCTTAGAALEGLMANPFIAPGLLSGGAGMAFFVLLISVTLIVSPFFFMVRWPEDPRVEPSRRQVWLSWRNLRIWAVIWLIWFLVLGSVLLPFTRVPRLLWPAGTGGILPAP